MTATSEPKWAANARQLIGLKEIVGSRHEPKVLEFFAEAGHPEIHNDETAWCAAFANAMLRRAGYAGTGSLAARSFLNWGQKLTEPRPGCIVVYKRGNSSWQGHVNFFTRRAGGKVYGIGGNQGNAVNEVGINEADVLGYRWPVLVTAPAAKPKPAPAKEAAKAGGAAAGGAVVVAGGAAAVEQGWGFPEFAVLFIILAAIGVAGYFGWQRWKARQATSVAVEPATAPVVRAIVKAAKSRARKPVAQRKPAAKPAAKKKPARKPAKRKAA